MPIKTSSWKVGDQVFATLQEAQRQELLELIGGPNNPDEIAIIKVIVEKANEVIRILSVREKKPRSDKDKRHRKSAPASVT